MANSSEIATRVRSPEDNRWIRWIRLPRGAARISMSLVSGSLSSASRTSHSPPSNNASNTDRKWSRMAPKVSTNMVRAVWSISRTAWSSASRACTRSSRWPVRNSRRLTSSACSSTARGVARPHRLDRLAQPFGFLLKGLGVAGDVGRAGEELVNGFVPLAIHPLHHGSTPGGGLRLPALEAVGLFAELEHLRSARFHRGLGCAERLLGLAHPGLRLLRGRLELLHLHPSLGQLVGPLGPLLRQRRGLGGDLGQLGFEPADGRFRLRQPLGRPALPLARRVLPRRHLGFLHLPVYPALARGLF